MHAILQTDRDAAADHILRIDGKGMAVDMVRTGKSDASPLVQSFAGYRIANHAALARIHDLSALWPMSLVSQIHEIASDGLGVAVIRNSNSDGSTEFHRKPVRRRKALAAMTAMDDEMGLPDEKVTSR